MSWYSQCPVGNPNSLCISSVLYPGPDPHCSWVDLWFNQTVMKQTSSWEGAALATCACRPGVRAIQGPVWCWSQGLEPGPSAQGTMLLLVWALRPFLRGENGFGAKISKKWNQPFQSKRVDVWKLKPVRHNDSRLSESLWELFFPKISHVPGLEHASHSSS